jgi:MFS family permease
MIRPTQSLSEKVAQQPRKFFYGWMIVAACTLMIGITYGLMYSYSVFFKPLADYFSWDRATVSVVYSASLIIRGAFAVGVGWLADRYGPVKLSIFCGVMIALGLVLASRATDLWQFFFTYAVIEAIGLSGAFGIGTAMVSRWFTKNRGLALGIVSTGSGLGTLFIVPGNERLISALGWSHAFLVCGITAGVVMIAAVFLLRFPPSNTPPAHVHPAGHAAGISPTEATLASALKDTRMMLLLGVFLLFFFCNQIIMVHLVNYATDIGIAPLIAATFISIIGAISIGGRLSAGAGSERIGINNTLILTHVFLVVSLVGLIFIRPLWSFYTFAVVFGFTYGAEVPLIPLFVGRFFGTRSMATIVGLVLFIGNIGGALGPWLAGKIYDATQAYHWAFIVGAIAAAVSLSLALTLKRQSRVR